MTEIDTTLHPHSNFRFHRWTREDDAVLERGYTTQRSVKAIARELGRTVAAVQVRASTYGLTYRKQTAPKKHAAPKQQLESPQPHRPHNWRDLTLLVTVGQRWSSYPKDTQDAFLERIGAVRR
jgi:hypothetical protein